MARTSLSSSRISAVNYAHSPVIVSFGCQNFQEDSFIMILWMQVSCSRARFRAHKIDVGKDRIGHILKCHDSSCNCLCKFSRFSLALCSLFAEIEFDLVIEQNKQRI
ncbi:hypothetical protein O6H91_Y505000 [Diphasiastrum complanatum]|nr:hypothetical protein O6H91_Y505000 [Diphasiastrum complanatum]